MGYDAEQKYNKDLEEKGATEDLHLYRHFKMALHDPKVAHLSSKEWIKLFLKATLILQIDRKID